MDQLKSADNYDDGSLVLIKTPERQSGRSIVTFYRPLETGRSYKQSKTLLLSLSTFAASPTWM